MTERPGLGGAAVQVLATQVAADSNHFAPFLADLADRCIRDRDANLAGRRVRSRVRFPAEVRATGLARVLMAAYGRKAAVVLIYVPVGLSAGDERALVAASEWLTHHARIAVWLAGAALQVVDRVRAVPITLPPFLTRLLTEADHPDPSADGVRPLEASGKPFDQSVDPSPAPHAVGPAPTTAVLTYPPRSGVPRPDSASERALERALATHSWAQGRHWNHTYEWHLLAKAYRLDLYWPTERLVVEVD